MMKDDDETMTMTMTTTRRRGGRIRKQTMDERYDVGC
jgi:hypothetical protein